MRFLATLIHVENTTLGAAKPLPEPLAGIHRETRTLDLRSVLRGQATVHGPRATATMMTTISCSWTTSLLGKCSVRRAEAMPQTLRAAPGCSSSGGGADLAAATTRTIIHLVSLYSGP